MNDTPLHIRKLPGEIIRQKPLETRLRMVFEMMEGGQKMVFNRLVRLHPEWSLGEIKAATFERIYRDDFPAEELGRIKTSIRMHHDQP